jgi:hypothetical protein
LKFAIGIRLNTLKTPAILKRDRAEDIQCCWCEKTNVDMPHIMTNCLGRNGFRYINMRLFKKGSRKFKSEMMFES